ncbi:glycosyltransferase [Desulfococcaceae bacterium HSG7]|nr:glycosyltransferase [Desulfococcaceae bacterium HSG7]
MRIVYVSREFGPVTGGGIGTYIYNVCRVMVKRGHQVCLVTDCFNDANRHLLPQDVKLAETLPSPKLRQGLFFNFHHEYSYRVLDTLRELSQKINIDVIEFAEFGTEGFASIRAKRLLNAFAGVKLIVKLHTPSSLLYHINEDKMLDTDSICRCYQEDYCVKYADQVTSPSQSLADYFQERVGRADILNCPYPMELPKLGQSKQFTADMIRCVRFFGSVQIRKGLDIFIEAAKLVLKQKPDFTFEIYGGDRNTPVFEKSYQTILQRNIPEPYTEKIRFIGAVDYSAIPSLMLDSCFCVFPSRWENWANVCLEAMSMGCVVIASEQGGMSEMIRHGQDGFLVNPLNPQEIADIILVNYEDSEFLETVSRAAHTRSKQICDPEKTGLTIETNYARPLDKKRWCKAEPQNATVSVVIPYYNQPEYLQKAVDSVKQSSYKPIEIVVINDGSSTIEANEAFEQLQDVVKVNKPNGGLSSARNAGIAAASGKFILPLDSDDKIDPDYIRLAAEALQNNPDLAYISCHAHNFGAFENAYIPLGYIPELMPFINTDGKCANLFRKSVFDRCGGYDEMMPSYEDWDFLITLHENGLQGDVLPDELFFYRRHFDSMVYETANRMRTQLIQYMLIKHEKAWKPYSSTMAIVLAWLWKETEKRDEFAHQQINNLALKPTHPAGLQLGASTRFQIYALHNGVYSEQCSVYAYYPQSEWTTLTLNMPFLFQNQRLRLDPSDLPGTIQIKEIRLISTISKRTLWRADTSNQFEECCVLCNDEHFFYKDCLVIKAATNDPQLMLPEFSYDEQQIKLSVTLRFGDDFNLD